MHWMTAKILRISIYYTSGHVEQGSLGDGQHQGVSAYKGSISLHDVLRAEILGEHKSEQSEEMSQPTITKKRKEARETETLVDEEPELEPGKPKLEEKISSLSKESKKSGEMLVMGKVRFLSMMTY